MASPPVHENTQARMRWDRGIKRGKMSAAGRVLIVPLTVLFYPIQRFLIRTLSASAPSPASSLTKSRL
jgi:ABC-type maltose transport system permease subunit